MQSIVLTALLAFGATLPAFTEAAFNESQIALATRRVWCKAQVSQCPALCADQDKEAIENECFPENLFYACVCDDGLRPNLTEYSETIPYYVCTIEQGECIKACGAGGNACAEACRKTHVCGATSPRKVNKTSSASASTTGGKAKSTGAVDDNSDGFASAGDVEDSNSGDSSAANGLLLQVGSAYGMGLLAAGIAAGAAFVGL